MFGFFFQAEDGIRDADVTGVQTCALPISEIGWLRGGLTVLVVRHGKTYDATNRLPLSAEEVRQLYRIRVHIEELIRVCKDHLGLTGYQARSEWAQAHHITCCLIA